MRVFWKGLAGTLKEGHFGTMEDIDFVPDSEPATQIEYEAWVSAKPISISQLEQDIAVMPLTASGVRGILERIRKGER
jgi:hypothetical protein